jgi:hypothetical protein
MEGDVHFLTKCEKNDNESRYFTVIIDKFLNKSYKTLLLYYKSSIFKKSLKIPKEQWEAVVRRSDNTMVKKKDKKTNNDPQNTTRESNEWIWTRVFRKIKNPGSLVHDTRPVSLVKSMVIITSYHMKTRMWTRLWLRQAKHISGYMWHRYSVTVNQVMVVTVKLSKRTIKNT